MEAPVDWRSGLSEGHKPMSRRPTTLSSYHHAPPAPSPLPAVGIDEKAGRAWYAALKESGKFALLFGPFASREQADAVGAALSQRTLQQFDISAFWPECGALSLPVEEHQAVKAGLFNFAIGLPDSVPPRIIENPRTAAWRGWLTGNRSRSTGPLSKPVQPGGSTLTSRLNCDNETSAQIPGTSR